jgi:hypothetical protein
MDPIRIEISKLKLKVVIILNDKRNHQLEAAYELTCLVRLQN